MMPPQNAAPERFLVAFVIQGDDVFRITADNIIQTPNAAGGASFDGISKLKAAAALMDLVNRHGERSDELRQMARELVSEGMRMLARSSSGGRLVSAAASASEAKIA